MHSFMFCYYTNVVNCDGMYPFSKVSILLNEFDWNSRNKNYSIPVYIQESISMMVYNWKQTTGKIPQKISFILALLWKALAENCYHK